MARIRKTAAVFICVLVMAVFSACGSADDSEDDGQDITEDITEETSEAGTEDEDYESSENEDGTLWAFNYDVESIVTLGEYRGLTYTIIDTSVTEEEVDEEISAIMDSYAEPEEVTDRAVENGDTVSIDFEGIMDGEAFDGGSASDYYLEIGSGSFIDGFEDGLIGVMPGVEVALNLTFPDDYYNGELAGQDVVFNVTVNFIEGDDIVPELNDDFVKAFMIEDMNTVEDMREYVREYLTADKEAEADSEIQMELIEKVMYDSVIDLPEEFVAQFEDEFIDTYLSYFEIYNTYYGVSWDEFLSDYLMVDEDTFFEDARLYGEEYASEMLVICAVAKAEGIEITDDIYSEKLSMYAQLYGYDEDEFEEYYGRETLIQSFLNEEVLYFLQENAIGLESEIE